MYTQHVDPLIGTDTGEGHAGGCVPAAQAPYGMISWGPSNVFDDYQAVESRQGYVYRKDAIWGFALTHLSGVGCHVMQDVPLSPVVGPLGPSPVPRRDVYQSAFDKATESATPGYYSVHLKDYKTDVQIAVAERSGIMALDFPEGEPAHCIVNPTACAMGLLDSEIEILPADRRIVGRAKSGGFCHLPAKDYPYTLYFCFEFDADFASFGAWDNETHLPGQSRVGGDTAAAYASFDPQNSQPVHVKVGLSYVDIDGAIRNLHHEIPHWNLDQTNSETDAKWEHALSSIHVESENPDRLKNFYTALYHAQLLPSIFQDVDGRYRGFDDQIHDAPDGHTHYANFSLWDTYRTVAALQAIVAPRRAADMAQSLLIDSQQGEGGGLPVFAINNMDTGVMFGYSAIPFVSTAHAFGADQFDTDAMRRKMIECATHYRPLKGSKGWLHVNSYRKYHYVPADIAEAQSVCLTVEYALDDFALAQFCRRLGDDQNADFFLKESENIFNLLNEEKGYLQKKDRHGNWVEPFDPCTMDGFSEGNSAHYTWIIPHAMPRLIEKLGGDAKARQRLDHLFSEIALGWKPTSPYCWWGNEPTLNMPFAYNWTSEPWKTQRTVRQLIDQTHLTSPGGIPGNDDAGTLSAWLVFAMLGLYPAIPGLAGFALSTPMFPKAIIKTSKQQEITITTQGDPETRPYIKALQINDQSQNGLWLDWSTIEKGAHLQFDLSERPVPDAMHP